MGSDPEFVTPLDVEREMLDLNSRLDAAPGVIKDHHNKVRAARMAYKRAYALAYGKAKGNQLDRKLAADLETEAEQTALDVAEIQYRFVVDTHDSLRTKLRALQSISSLMKASMFSPQGGI